MSLPEIQVHARPWRWDDHTVEEHEAQIAAFYYSAVEKGWTPSEPVWADNSKGPVLGEDMMRVVLPPLMEFVENLIAVGCTLLAGKPKKGKSWLLLLLLLCIAGGWPAFGRLRCQKTGVLYLALEDSTRRLQSRCTKLLAHLGKEMPDSIYFDTAWPRGKAAVEALEKWLDDHPEIRVVGIDILARVKEATTKDGPAYSDDYNTLSVYQQLAQRRGIAIIITHHTRKADSDDPIDLVSGTLGIVGAADHVVLLTGSKEKGYQLTTSGRDVPDVAWDMELNDGAWSILGDRQPTPTVKDPVGLVEELELKVKCMALHAEGVSKRDMATRLGVSRWAISKVFSSPKQG